MARISSTTKLLYLFLLHFVMNFQAFAYILESNAVFSNKLFKILSRSEENVIYSPISAHTVLSLAYQGAIGETASTLETALELTDANTAAENYRILIENLRSTKNVEIDLVNKIFISPMYVLNDKFNHTADEYFSSDVENINFWESDKAANKINNWIESKTNNKVKHLVDPEDLSVDSTLLLVNTIYFKGQWFAKFENIVRGKFYLSDMEVVNASIMNIRQAYKYIDDKDLEAQVISLPYRNSDFSLLVVLPNSKTGIKDVADKFHRTNLTQLYGTMKFADVSLSLPKFKIDATMSLKDPLREIGLDVFFDNAELPNMLEPSQHINVTDVLQKAFLEIDENGTEVAAGSDTTTKLIDQTDFFIKEELPKVVFTADHPFLFSLCYRNNDIMSPFIVGILKNPN